MINLLPPHNTEAESCVLGAILLKGEELLETAMESLTSRSFYHPKHQTVFETFQQLRELKLPVDVITVSDRLQREGELEKIGGIPFLAALTEQAVGSFNFESHCGLVRERAIARRVISVAQDVQSRAFNESFDSVAGLVEYTQKQVLSLDDALGSQGTLHDISDVMRLSVGEIEKRYHTKSSILGLSSGFKSLDELTNGFKPGELIILAARPSMGKTACSLSLAANIALGLKKRVAYFSIEMPKETLVMRMLAARAAIPLDRVMTGRIHDQEWPRLITAAGDIADSRLLIDESSPLSPYELKSRCRRLKHTSDLDCIMVDYLQMMRIKDQRVETREREVAEISITLKSVAKELGIPVIALAQLNREADKRSDNRPSISDIRESGSIEMDADVIMLLFREEYYDRNNPEVAGKVEIIVAKNRNGKTGVANMRFESALNRFVDE